MKRREHPRRQRLKGFSCASGVCGVGGGGATGGLKFQLLVPMWEVTHSWARCFFSITEKNVLGVTIKLRN